MTARGHWRGIAVLLVLLLGLGVLPFAGLVPDPLATDSGLVVTGIRARAPTHALISHQVYGYLPYWQLDGSTAQRLRYDLLTTIAMFGIGIERTGDLDRTTPGYKAYASANAIAVINAAHEHGVRVVPTFQLFDGGKMTEMNAFLGSSEAQQRFIDQALAIIVGRRADGANFDFEPLPGALTGKFATFLARFRAALLQRVPDGTVVVALGASASGKTIARLAPLVDQLFVMAYDYRTTRSTTAGPVAPLDARWLSVRSDIARYVANAPPGKVILGMPVYGYDWPVTDRSAGANVRRDSPEVGGAFAVTYTAVTRFLAEHPALPVRYDLIADAPYFTYHDHDTGTYRQVWFEDRAQPQPEGRPRAVVGPGRCRPVGARRLAGVRNDLGPAPRQAARTLAPGRRTRLAVPRSPARWDGGGRHHVDRAEPRDRTRGRPARLGGPRSAGARGGLRPRPTDGRLAGAPDGRSSTSRSALPPDSRPGPTA